MRLRAFGEAGIEQVGHVVNGHRPVGHAACRRAHFDHRLQPEQAARAVAHHAERHAANRGFLRDALGHALSADRQCGRIARDINGEAHAQLPYCATSASNERVVMRACGSSLIVIAGDEAHRPRQKAGSSVKFPSFEWPCALQPRRSSAWAKQRIGAHRLAGLGSADLDHVARRGRGAKVVVVGDDAMHFGAREVHALGDRRSRCAAGCSPARPARREGSGARPPALRRAPAAPGAPRPVHRIRSSWRVGPLRSCGAPWRVLIHRDLAVPAHPTTEIRSQTLPIPRKTVVSRCGGTVRE
jgi:hypothetical protein